MLAVPVYWRPQIMLLWTRAEFEASAGRSTRSPRTAALAADNPWIRLPATVTMAEPPAVIPEFSIEIPVTVPVVEVVTFRTSQSETWIPC